MTQCVICNHKENEIQELRALIYKLHTTLDNRIKHLEKINRDSLPPIEINVPDIEPSSFDTVLCKKINDIEQYLNDFSRSANGRMEEANKKAVRSELMLLGRIRSCEQGLTQHLEAINELRKQKNSSCLLCYGTGFTHQTVIADDNMKIDGLEIYVGDSILVKSTCNNGCSAPSDTDEQ